MNNGDWIPRSDEKNRFILLWLLIALKTVKKMGSCYLFIEDQRLQVAFAKVYFSIATSQTEFIAQN